MRRFVVGIVLDALILFIVLAVLGLLTVPQPFPFGAERVHIVTLDAAGAWAFLFAGLVIALVDGLVRPVIVALTGRLVLSTMGAFLVVVNAITLWVASLFAPQLAIAASPRILWFLVVAALFTILSMLTDAVFGLNIPDIDESGRGRAIWRLLDAVPTPRRSRIIENVRLQQVYDMIYQYGLDIAIERTPVGSFRAAFQRRVLGRVAPDAATPEAKTRILLQQLGPTYVKLGQMAASRPEALPPALVEELAKLQSDAAPFPWAEAEAILVHELRGPVEEHFTTFEHEPFAAASTAQVHRATLPDGRTVAVKVQRPRILAQTKADLGVLEELAKVAERRFELAHRLGAQAMVREFAAGVIKELDYQNEAYHALRIAESMRAFPEIHIPVVDTSRSTSRVLTAEYVSGIKISDAERLRAAGLDTSHLGTVFIRAMIKQILVDGFFHGDPHPGNVLVDPDSRRIIFLDFGLVGELRTDQRTTLIQLLLGLKGADSAAIADALIGLGQPGPDWDERRFRRDIDRVVRQYLIYSHVDSIGEGIGAVLGAVVDNGLRLDSDLTLAIKAVVQAEETARSLSVEVDIASAAFDQARAAILERLAPEAVERFLSGQAIRVGQELLRRVPELEMAAWSWLDQFGKGRLVVSVDTSDLNRQIAKVGDLGRQVAIGMLVTGQLIGTAILAAVLLQPNVADEFQTFGYIGLVAFGISLVVSMYVLFHQLQSTNSDEA
ncbi:MAG: AarF/UbiB family protein [Candidatus Limnocylindrales bacterium]